VVTSALLYAVETWTVLVADMNVLKAIHMRCQRLVLDIRWWAHVSNSEVFQRSGLSIGDISRHRRLSLFGHVARLDPGVSAYEALRLMVGTKAESQWPAGEDHGAPSQLLAQQGSGGCQVANTVLLSILSK